MADKPKAGEVISSTENLTIPNNGMDAEYWKRILDDVNSTTGQLPIYRLKEGSVSFKLVTLPDSPRMFHHQLTSYWKGKPRTKFGISVIILRDGQNERGITTEDGKYAVKVMQIGSEVLKQILSFLQEGHDLLGYKDGHALKLTRTGAGLQTEYNLVTSPKPIAIGPDQMSYPDPPSIFTLCDNLSARNKERSQNGQQDEGEEGEDQPLAKGNKGGGGKFKTPADW